MLKQLEKENEELRTEVKRLKYELEKENQLNLKFKEKIDNYNKKLEEKEKKINKLSEELEELRAKYSLSPGEKLLPIIFVSVNQRLHYSIICKNTDPFSKIERQLYNENKEFDDPVRNYFLAGGKMIDKKKTIEENGIKYSEIITLNNNDQFSVMSSLNNSAVSNLIP